MGLDFEIKKIVWDDKSDVQVQLWDLGGQDRFKGLTRVYYQNAVGAIMVFDCTNEESMIQTKGWKADLDSKVTWNGKPIPVVLFANKIDQPVGEFMKDRSVLDDLCDEHGFIGWYSHCLFFWKY